MEIIKILVTGAAGFIGFHVSKRLLEIGHAVTGYDNMNEYYDVKLKRARLKQLKKYKNFTFHPEAVEDDTVLENVFSSSKFDYVIHLAAQAGVRYSLKDPQTYIDSNITGFLNILECCKKYPVRHLVYASSSSVYGNSKTFPSMEADRTDEPASLYAVSKKCNELMAASYNHLYNIQCTGLRFHTVYGPWGRPDMALFVFTENILAGIPIPVYNKGEMRRDFTYIDDIVNGIIAVRTKPDGNRVFNIGRGEPVALMDFIKEIELATSRTAILDMQPMQPGDVKTTYASTADLTEHTDYKPEVSIKAGIQKFVEWYKDYYKA